MNDQNNLCPNCMALLEDDYNAVFDAPRKIVWRQITDEPLQLGDMWANHDPNQIYQQGRDIDYNLQMQALSPQAFGICPSENNKYVNLGNGAYWRPVKLVEIM